MSFSSRYSHHRYKTLALSMLFPMLAINNTATATFLCFFRSRIFSHIHKAPIYPAVCFASAHKHGTYLHRTQKSMYSKEAYVSIRDYSGVCKKFLVPSLLLVLMHPVPYKSRSAILNFNSVNTKLSLQTVKRKLSDRSTCYLQQYLLNLCSAYHFKINHC